MERFIADLVSAFEGGRNVRDAGPRSLQMEDGAGYPIQICGLEDNALTDK